MNRPILSLRVKESPQPAAQIRIRNIKTVECPTCRASVGERCSPGFVGHWNWCEKRILISDGKIPDPSDPEDFDDCYFFDERDYEAEEEQREQKHKEYLRGLTPEELSKEWDRECLRHDNSVDRCEDMNNPTIEDAVRWMNFIDRVFKERGLDRHKYNLQEEEDNHVG